MARTAPDDTTAACLAWVARVARPLCDIASPDTAMALLDDACVRVDGCGSVASDTRRRRRGVLSSMLDHAVSRGVLGANPLSGLTTRRARSSDAINPRTIPDYTQAGRLLRAIETSTNPTDRYLHAFFTLAYLAGTRPGETRAIRDQDIIWPEHVTDPDAAPGWGVLVAGGSRTEVDASYTDDGQNGEDRGLKGREQDAVRMVPLPPEAVAVLRHHIATYGGAPDGRLFWHHTARKMYDVLPGKVYRRTWRRARATALTDAERAL
ncbi:hypothetical protein [Allosalinactinospora lopnorensis]|uniref:hypothetical protein n=1 Tax=Allosalinactinospora lopnorensis TaxID=1352348 RepID=UPI0012E175A1|nr:hypothetical protein [Allosalinactinospora lopnorensis]